jgi:hypothetical protein
MEVGDGDNLWANARRGNLLTLLDIVKSRAGDDPVGGIGRLRIVPLC